VPLGNRDGDKKNDMKKNPKMPKIHIPTFLSRPLFDKPFFSMD
jgi:hypothetical protein